MVADTAALRRALIQRRQIVFAFYRSASVSKMNADCGHAVTTQAGMSLAARSRSCESKMNGGCGHAVTAEARVNFIVRSCFFVFDLFDVALAMFLFLAWIFLRVLRPFFGFDLRAFSKRDLRFAARPTGLFFAHALCRNL